MEQILDALAAVGCLVAIGVMMRMTMRGRRGSNTTDRDEIKRLLTKFDQLDAQPEPRDGGTAGFRNRNGDTMVADGAHSADEWPPRLM